MANKYNARHRSGLNILPAHMQRSVQSWIESPCHPDKLGRFLHAVLSDQLVASFSFADEENGAAMSEWAKFLYLYAPRGSWGSESILMEWYDSRGEREWA